MMSTHIKDIRTIYEPADIYNTINLVKYKQFIHDT